MLPPSVAFIVCKTSFVWNETALSFRMWRSLWFLCGSIATTDKQHAQEPVVQNGAAQHLTNLLNDCCLKAPPPTHLPTHSTTPLQCTNRLIIFYICMHVTLETAQPVTACFILQTRLLFIKSAPKAVRHFVAWLTNLKLLFVHLQHVQLHVSENLTWQIIFVSH